MRHFEQNKETDQLDKIILAHFSQLGWNAMIAPSQEHLLRVSKDSAIFYIKSLDASPQFSIGILPYIDKLQSLSRAFRSHTGPTIAYVTRDPLLGLQPDSITDRTIALFNIDEITLLSNLGNADIFVPADLSKRELLVVQGCDSLCIRLSNEALKRQDFITARGWLELCIDGTYTAMKSRIWLVDMLIKNNEFDSAKEIVNKGLQISPYDVDLLKRLKGIETKLNNTDAAAKIDERIAISSNAKPSFESILNKRSSLEIHDNESFLTKNSISNKKNFFINLFTLKK